MRVRGSHVLTAPVSACGALVATQQAGVGGDIDLAWSYGVDVPGDWLINMYVSIDGSPFSTNVFTDQTALGFVAYTDEASYDGDLTVRYRYDLYDGDANLQCQMFSNVVTLHV